MKSVDRERLEMRCEIWMIQYQVWSILRGTPSWGGHTGRSLVFSEPWIHCPGWAVLSLPDPWVGVVRVVKPHTSVLAGSWS